MAFQSDTKDKKPGAETTNGRKRLRFWVVAAILAGLLVYAGSWTFFGKRAAGQGPPAARSGAPVVVAAAKQGDIPVYLPVWAR